MERRFGLSSFSLKLIAVAAMTIDHIGWLFVSTYSPLGMAMHTVGRLTAPIMAFFVAEGYYHTRDIKKYAARLGLFALLSHIPFTFYMHGRFLLIAKTGVMYTLFLGLLALIIAKQERLHILLKIPLIVIILFLSQWGDWREYMVLWVLAFGLLRQHRGWAMAASASITTFYYALPFLQGPHPPLFWRYSLYNLGGLLVVPLLLLYNGRPGRIRLKYFFYLYYPLHLFLIRFLYIWLR